MVQKKTDQAKSQELTSLEVFLRVKLSGLDIEWNDSHEKFTLTSGTVTRGYSIRDTVWKLNCGGYNVYTLKNTIVEPSTVIEDVLWCGIKLIERGHGKNCTEQQN
jgi:hypothetical protein